MGLLGSWLNRLYNQAARLNTDHMGELLEAHPQARYLDLGCDDGVWSARWADRIGTPHRFGVEIVEERAELSRTRGFEVRSADLNREIPFADESMDVVTANQVIEHLAEPDRFAEESYRVLRPGGVAVISTENLASWPNVAAVALGQEPFSNSYSKRFWLGNRFSRRYGPLPEEVAAYPHRSVGSYSAISELFVHYGFRRFGSFGVHILPLPVAALRWLRRVDVRHSMYISFVFRKPADASA